MSNTVAIKRATFTSAHSSSLVLMDQYFSLESGLNQLLGFPGGSGGKESACNVGDLGSIPGLGRTPGGGHGNLLQYSCLEKPYGQQSLEVLQSVGSQRVGHDWVTQHTNQLSEIRLSSVSP